MSKQASRKKAELRARYLDIRKSLTQADVETKSRAVIERLQSLPVCAEAAAVLTYVASKDNEVDTRPLIASLLDEGRVVLVPIVRPERVLEWSRLEAVSELQPARFGILEPAEQYVRPLEPPSSSLVLVPGIAFSPEGRRIGYGGGYFDRFLARFPGAKVALAFDCQITDAIPLEPHDVPVDAVVTESRVLSRGRE